MTIPLGRYWALLAAYFWPQGGRVALLGLGLLGNIAFRLGAPTLSGRFIDAALAGASVQLLTVIALVFFAVAVLEQVTAVATAYLSENVAWTATNALRSRLARHCVRLDMSFHKAHTPGELIERVDGDVTALANFFSEFVLQMLANVLLLVGILGVLFAYNPWLGIAFGEFALVFFIAMDAVRNLAVPAWTAVRAAAAEQTSFLEERLAGTEDIAAVGMAGHVLRRFHALVAKRYRAALHAGRMNMVSFGLGWVGLVTVGYVLSFVVGYMLYTRGAISVGTIFVTFLYVNLMLGPLQEIANQLQDLQQAAGSITRVEDLLRAQSAIRDGPGRPPPRGMLGVAFERVTFGYEPGTAVLRALDFELAPGSVLGLLGRTGSGKTTIGRLLFRLYDPREGIVRLGGVDLRAMRVADVRRRVGLVTQDVQLFHASVRDNLTLFDRAVPDGRILDVLEGLGLGPWLLGLPRGLDTELAPGGAGLSAGEGQLLAFARVFLRDPGLVILDEASSRLDPATEFLLERAVDRLLAGRTGIVIAHRLATVQRADDIMVLEEGRVVERGPRRALAADPGSRFAALLRAGLEAVTA